MIAILRPGRIDCGRGAVLRFRGRQRWTWTINHSDIHVAGVHVPLICIFQYRRFSCKHFIWWTTWRYVLFEPVHYWIYDTQFSNRRCSEILDSVDGHASVLTLPWALYMLDQQLDISLLDDRCYRDYFCKPPSPPYQRVSETKHHAF